MTMAKDPTRPLSSERRAIHTLTEVRAVSFDLGGTIVRIGQSPTTGLIATRVGISLEAARRAVERQAKRHRWNPADLAYVLADEFGCPDARADLEEILVGAQRGGQRPTLYADASPTLRALSQRGYRVFALSNALGSSAPPEPPAFHDLFEGVFTSYDTGWCKPEQEAFEAVRRQTDLKPVHFLHVGNSLRADVHGALDAGWNAALLVRPDASVPTDDDLPDHVLRLRGLASLLPILPGVH